jgi:predicted anti-sigma-YlaC factor YlaD
MCKMETWLLEDYVDGILDTATTALIDLHLHTCDECRHEFTRIKLLFWELESIRRAPVEIPDSLNGIEAAILNDWLSDRKESWIGRTEHDIATAMQVTSSIFAQIPGMRKTGEIVGLTSKKSVKWVGRKLFSQIKSAVKGEDPKTRKLLPKFLSGGGS